MPIKKVTDLRPCDNCGGPIHPNFMVVRVSQAVIDANAVNQVLGTAQLMGGSIGFGELFAGEPQAVKVFGDVVPALWTELVICQDCFYGNTLELPILVEKAQKKNA